MQKFKLQKKKLSTKRQLGKQINGIHGRSLHGYKFIE